MTISDNTRGLILAISSSLFIGTSFILKKKGLKRAAAAGTRAGVGGYAYLLEPLWWTGMITMIVGEVANFVAYIYAPAVLVTPLGVLSIIISALLAHFMLKERLQRLGVLGCISCIVGSVVIVIHAPQENMPASLQEIWMLATQPAFLIYVAATLSMVLALILHFEPRYGQTNILVYLGICSLMGSFTVNVFSFKLLFLAAMWTQNCFWMWCVLHISTVCYLVQRLVAVFFSCSLQIVSIKAIGIAIKLTLEGISQVAYPQTWFFLSVAVICVVTQLNYLNKALDTFNTAIVSPIYYVMFTTMTIIASAIMFKDWAGQSGSDIVSAICGFITVLSGTIMLHVTREQEPVTVQGTVTWYNGEHIKTIEDGHYILLHDSEYLDSYNVLAKN
ncbi:putative magnesium transporter NIPA6 [Capsicum annuum]